MSESILVVSEFTTVAVTGPFPANTEDFRPQSWCLVTMYSTAELHMRAHVRLKHSQTVLICFLCQDKTPLVQGVTSGICEEGH